MRPKRLYEGQQNNRKSVPPKRVTLSLPDPTANPVLAFVRPVDDFMNMLAARQGFRSTPQYKRALLTYLCDSPSVVARANPDTVVDFNTKESYDLANPVHAAKYLKHLLTLHNAPVDKDQLRIWSEDEPGTDGPG